MVHLANGHGKPAWREVTGKNPCPTCQHGSWCRITEDGSLWACRRSDADGGVHKTDKNGEPYWLHRRNGIHDAGKWAEPKYSLSDCPKDEEGKPTLVDPDVLHEVYQRFLACLPLRYRHAEDLERRGLKEGCNALGFRSLGRERAQAAYRLVKAGLEKHLPGVPGFYVAEKDGRRFWSVAGMGGLLIPIRDTQGRIVALSVRLDEPPDGGGKYRFVSSKKKGGVGPGAPVHVPKFAGDKTTVRVTEGALKADIATRLSGILTIGLPGVSSWKRAARVLKELGAKTVRVAFDADARRNRNVARCLAHLIGHLRSKGFTVELETWDVDDAKGIDDLLAADKQTGLIPGDEAVDCTVREIVAAAEVADPTPAGPSVEPGKAVEAYNDPHLLARDYRAQFRFGGPGGLETLFFHRQEFVRWDGRAYRTLNEKEVKAELTAAIKTDFDRQNLKQLAAWKANGAEGNPPTAPQVTTKAVGNAMQALTGMALLPSCIESPAWLLGCFEDSAAGDVLACRNALVHLPSLVAGKEQSIGPTPLFFSPNALDYDFDPNAMQPTNWLAFLHALWPKDQQAIDTLQEWFGYCLLPDTSQHKILMIVGPRRSGKGTIARVLRALIGMQNTASPTLAGLGTNFGLQPLLNKTLAIISDARLSHRTDAAVVVERLLSISGEDAQTIDRKHLTALTLKLAVRFMILTNELPKLNDPSGALVGRLILLRQTESWYGREDTGLTNRLLPELPGILLWAIEGWKRLRERGHFLQPESGRKIVQQMEDLSSPVGVFLRECCEVGPGFEVPCKDLFRRWERWCEEKGHKDAGSEQTFGRDLRAAIPGLDTKNPRCGSMRMRVYMGIRERRDPEGEPNEPREREPG